MWIYKTANNSDTQKETLTKRLKFEWEYFEFFLVATYVNNINKYIATGPSVHIYKNHMTYVCTSNMKENYVSHPKYVALGCVTHRYTV